MDLRPSLEGLEANPNTIAFLPTSEGELNGQVTAGFRPAAQEMRVLALEKGLNVEMLAPEGAQLGIHQEHAADIILPVLASFVPGVASSLVADYIFAWLTRGGNKNEVVRCELVEIENGSVRLHNVEGPAEELLDYFRDATDKALAEEESQG